MDVFELTGIYLLGGCLIVSVVAGMASRGVAVWRNQLFVKWSSLEADKYEACNPDRVRVGAPAGTDD